MALGNMTVITRRVGVSICAIMTMLAFIFWTYAGDSWTTQSLFGHYLTGLAQNGNLTRVNRSMAQNDSLAKVEEPWQDVARTSEKIKSSLTQFNSIQVEEPWQDVARTSEKIKSSLTETCKHLGYNGENYGKLTKDQKNYIVVDDEHHVLYCRVPKVGMTNWHRVFAFLSGSMTEKRIQDIGYERVYGYYRDKMHFIKYIHSFSQDKAIYRIKNYFKFVFIRDPFERLVSAYRHIFEKYKWLYMSEAVQKYLATARPQLKEITTNSLSKNVTFEEFVSYVVDSHVGKEHQLDEHLRPQHIMCNPCLINFDFIGKYETITEGADYVLHKMGVADKVSYPVRNLSYSSPRSNNVLWSYYDTLSFENLWKIYRLYYADYLLFDFPLPEFLETLKQGWHP